MLPVSPNPILKPALFQKAGLGIGAPKYVLGGLFYKI